MIFSLPFTKEIYQNETLTQSFGVFVEQHKALIHDVYFSLFVKPFTGDAMGEELDYDTQIRILQDMLSLQRSTGVMVSGTLNGIHISHCKENLDLFVNQFRPLYEAGLRSLTLPHTHWMRSGEIKKHFPELFVKNTVLRRVGNAQEFWDCAQAGFDYVNLDRNLMRDERSLRDIKRAQSKFREQAGKYVKISILANEGCGGWCPLMDEHYVYNIARLTTPNKTSYAQCTLSAGCPQLDRSQAMLLKRANIPPFREDYQRLLQYVDVFKLHGRISVPLLLQSMEIIQNYANGAAVTNPSPWYFPAFTDIPAEKLKTWRKHIRNCRFQCWDCSVCEEVFRTDSGMSVQLAGQ